MDGSTQRSSSAAGVSSPACSTATGSSSPRMVCRSSSGSTRARAATLSSAQPPSPNGATTGPLASRRSVSRAAVVDPTLLASCDNVVDERRGGHRGEGRRGRLTGSAARSGGPLRSRLTPASLLADDALPRFQRASFAPPAAAEACLQPMFDGSALGARIEGARAPRPRVTREAGRPAGGQRRCGSVSGERPARTRPEARNR